MPQHTEEEISRRQRRDRLRFPIPDAKEQGRPKLPLIARAGRATGRFSAQTTRNAEQARAAGIGDIVNESGERSAEFLRRSGRQFSEGRSAGQEDRPIDTSAFNPGEGTTDKTPRPDAPVTSQAQTPEPIDRPRPGFTGQPDIGPRQAGGIVEPNLEDVANQPVSLADRSTANVVPTGGGSKQIERPDFNETGKLADLPEGFTQVIKGLDVGFQDAGFNQFRSVPGLTPEESRDVATRGDSRFNIQTQESLSRERINTQNFNAESVRLEAVFGNAQIGFDENGIPTLGIPDPDGGGLRNVDGFTPQLDAIATDTGRFELSVVPGDNVGDPEQTMMLDTSTGERRNLTRHEKIRIGTVKLANAIKREGGNLSNEDMLQLLREIEQEVGGLPDLESAILARQ